MPDDWQKTDEIFNAALEIEGAEREAYLVEICAGNVELEAEVRHFLKMSEQSDVFLDRAPEIPAKTDPDDLRQAVEQGAREKALYDDLEPGTRLGAYQIVESINAGGMGSVYLAERADGQFEQRVAIKVMHRSRGEANLVDRFLRERQILARLEHPNIARLIDGGVTEDGRPYLIMEYVEGEDIVSHCTNRNLSQTERLKLFLRVCHVVQHAHEKGVIHRDLKPNNIMVNAAGEVKLLDFGIARLLATHPDKALTGLGSAMLTPSHASPEQIRGASSSELSDIYQLGMVLYELLAGRLPVGESPRPPTQVAGASRSCDLDWICLKALASEPEDRYTSAQELAGDIENYMSSRPVIARGQTFGYLASRLGSRHRTVWLGVAVLILAILALSYLTGRGERASPIASANIQDRSIAVLPFETIGVETSLPLTEGIHSDLLVRLADVSDLVVIARQSVRPYKHSSQTPRQISRELGVRWLLEGSIQQQGDEINITVQLIDPNDGRQVWTEAYLRTLDTENLFAVQGDIATEIAQKLEARITPESRKHLMARPTTDLQAYRLYVQGRTLLDTREEANMHQALGLFRRAIERDPDYAMAWVGLADAIYLLLDYGFAMSPDSIIEAEQAASRALQLQPDLGEAYGALSGVEYLKLNGPAALQSLRRSIELSPENADLLGRMSWAGLLMGKPDEALAAARRAIAINPLAVEPFHNLVFSLLIDGRYQEAHSELQNRTAPRAPWDSDELYKGVLLYHMGRFQEAIDSLENLSVPWAGEGALATVGLAQAGMGNDGEAHRILTELEELNAHPYLIGLVEVSLGDREAAWQSFESALVWDADSDWPTLAARYLYRDLLGEMAQDQRFINLLARINQAWGLSEIETIEVN